jgi:uncharacterized BrkB/YihY/UPF0761 family membrane protein
VPEETDKVADDKKRNFFSEWTSGDTKVLVITIAATVAANIITVLIVALAVILARTAQPHPGTPEFYALFLGFTAYCVFGVIMVFSGWRNAKARKSEESNLDPTTAQIVRIARWVIAVLGTLILFGTLIFVLAVVGFAVGVK